jgi:hypothetical protein
MAAALGASRTALRTLCRRSPAFAEAFAEAETLASAWWDRLARQATYDRRLNANVIAKTISHRARYDNVAPAAQSGTTPNAGPSAPSVVDPEIRARIEAMLQAQVARKAWAR